jgi:regulator of ribonuclease activity A
MTTLTLARSTADLCDDHGDRVQVCEPTFHEFGGRSAFHGPISTVRCFEDNSRVKEAVESPGEGRVLVVDGGGSRRRALLGDKLGLAAVSNGWVGVIIHGCIRDSAELGRMDLGIRALGTMPLRSDKRGEGERDVPVRFAGVTFRPGEFVYVDEDGIIVAATTLA